MTRLKPLLIAAALMSAAAPAAVRAQVGPAPRPRAGEPVAQVSIRFGSELGLMADRYGRKELDELAEVLQDRIAIDAAKGGFVRADIVLEDARPNRPTLRQQSIRSELSSRSVALGGARVSGTLTRADGSTQPLTYSYFDTDLTDLVGFTTWYGAERAFSYLGSELARGRVSTRLGPGTPNPYRCQSSFDVWCTGV